ncbi:LysR family transcriptional regulator [Kitasatospora sp. MMS16-BH015]|uniref:LysR substrate-binding domain-containing protein n=1 Tax=Kitasatospora sp. MMS16-BH015 TaxID=2018025 RepID=UPI000CA0B4C2|nr:LysR substrate-binding domain-containing protein [Kitasatospora sp. MMS16-BH015]AUG78853.1 LysR family transcriptional regulator [Kitasatospora sp. MMS16-BH015]
MDLRRLRHFVAVAEELHYGRAATRPQPGPSVPSPGLRELEAELGCRLFEPSALGLRLSPAGEVLLGEARELLEAAERARETGRRTLVVAVVAGAAPGLGRRAVRSFRRTHPEVDVHLREADLTDPTAGLRSGRVDLALTRLPFDTAGLAVHPLGTEPLVAVLAADDPLGRRPALTVAELRARPWIRLPDAADPAWRAYWAGESEGSAPAGATVPPPRSAPLPRAVAGPVVRTVPECLHAVVWQRAVGLLPAGTEATHRADGIRFVPVTDYPPSRAVLARPAAEPCTTVLAFAAAVVAAALA